MAEKVSLLDNVVLDLAGLWRRLYLIGGNPGDTLHIARDQDGLLQRFPRSRACPERLTWPSLNSTFRFWNARIGRLDRLPLILVAGSSSRAEQFLALTDDEIE